MVAYSFKKQFAPLIVAGVKPHTMRNVRKGRVEHVRPGQAMQLYTGMRTRQCRKIGDAVCKAVLPVVIDFGRRTVKIEGRPMIRGRAQTDSFAVTDGFLDWGELAAFWRKEHGDDLETWAGVLIEWQDFKPA